jgi:5-methylcytosine-specific restriction endonuclease McrA
MHNAKQDRGKMNSADILKRSKRLERESFYDLFDALTECSSILNEIKPNKRRMWLIHVVDELYRGQKGLCAICGEKITQRSCEVDHVIPFCYGGGNEKGNLQLACLRCNRTKSKKVDPRDLLEYLEDRAMNL